jgi:hypothetical protein
VAGASYVAIAITFGISTGIIGKLKGSSFWIWFLIGLVVPGIGLLVVLLYRWDTKERRRQCPNSGRVVKRHDALCTRCGCELEFPDVAIESEADAFARKASVNR